MSARTLLFVVLVLGLTGVIGYSTFETAKLLRTWRPTRNLLLVPAENGVRLLLIALCIGLGLMSGLPGPVLGWSWLRVGWQVGWGLLSGGAIALFFLVTTRWLVRRTGERYFSPLVYRHILPGSRREAALIPLALVPVVLLEELLFRSLWIGGLSLILPSAFLWVASSLLFGMLHSPQGTWGVVGATLAGLLFGALFLWEGSLLLPVVAHFGANLVQIAYATVVEGPISRPE